MVKIRLTKGELKRQRDALRQYERFLPTLQLKKQQLQMEIAFQLSILDERRRLQETKKKAALIWAGLLEEAPVAFCQWLKVSEIIKTSKNIAGVDVPQFLRAEFSVAEYDLFSTPMWVDAGLEMMQALVALREEIRMIEQGIAILRRELRTTTQRVNLFEKVKIPEAKETIRLIKIYIGDQMTNAVGRSKIAKRKLEENSLELILT